MDFKVLEVRKVVPQTPLFLVLYNHDLKDHWPMRGLEWVQELVCVVPLMNATVSEPAPFASPVGSQCTARVAVAPTGTQINIKAL